MRKHLPALLGVVMVTALAASAAYAQTGSAEIIGNVVDAAGAPVPRAALIVSNVEANSERHVSADDQGRFMAVGLPPGEYHVTAQAPGFAPRRQEDLILSPNERATVRLALRRAPMPETLTIAESPARLETARSDAHHTIEPEQLENLPNRDRAPLALSGLAPATTVIGANGDPSVMAHDPTLNRYVVDGLNRTDSLTGTSRVLAPLSSIGAFDVRINAYNAEGGGAGAGVFNIATKAAANRLHGSLFDFYGDRSLNALTTLDRRSGARPPYRSQQFGGVISGPLVRNRDFFLLSYEGVRQTVAGGTSADFSPFMSSDPRSTAALAQLQALAAREPRDSRRDMWMLKGNHELSGGTLRLQYAERRVNGMAAGVGGPAPNVPSTGAADARARMFGAALGAAAGRFVNEARAQYATDRDRETGGTPALTVFQGGALVLRAGNSLLGPHDVKTERVQVGNTVSIAHGAHAVRAGVDALLDQNDINPNALSRGTYVFRSLASFASGTPGAGESYAQTFVTDSRRESADVRTYSAFAQDTWRISPAVTADLGVRYDVQAFARLVPRDGDNWAPRVALAIRRGDHAVIRSGYGLYYGFTPALIPAMALLSSEGRITTLTVGNAAAPTYPNTLARVPTTLPSTTIVDARFENAEIHQAHLGYEVEKYRIGTGGISYVFARGTNLPRMVEANGRGAFSGFGRVAEYRSIGESLYNAVTVRGRLTRTALTFGLAYTFARMDATPFGFTPVQPATIADRSVLPDILSEQRAPGDADHHHHATMSLVYDTTSRAGAYHGLTRVLLRNWTLSFTYDALSGAPYSAYADADLNGDGNPFNDLAPATTRNQYRLPWQASLNPRASRDFHFGDGRKVSLIWEAFNLTNRPNYLAADDVLYTMTATGLQRNRLFGRKTAQGEGRVMQLAARVVF